MIKVITYGTFDLLHYGHIRLLERAKALGDYLIVGVTADDFDKVRGKINVQRSLMERVEAVRATGIADEIVIEEYEGQKIDDIKRYDIDIFTVGSDWVGYFDYLKEYCEVIYIDRTQGVSSSKLRSEKRELRIGLVGESTVLGKVAKECQYVNGVKVTGICSMRLEAMEFEKEIYTTESYERLLDLTDAVYLVSHPTKHYEQIKKALEFGKHVICESPIALSKQQCLELFQLAEKNQCVLFEGIKTAYSTAYSRLLLQIKSGKIGRIISVDATCTSLKDIDVFNKDEMSITWNSICAWGPTAMLPVFQLLGIDYKSREIVTHMIDKNSKFDAFTKINFVYHNAVASIKVGKGIKSEGDLVISGTEGYAYIPAPWWKTDYFELRYENPADNKRFFYQLDGEGIRYEIVAFVKAIQSNKNMSYINKEVSSNIAGIIEAFENNVDIVYI
ncbi:Gfo/Idh/MocA family oxidoreductase [Hungatella sp.]|uniref:Gfo/Idh/MocA family oxidoreductase n=1 Tax=Hungatella sp. TaxID=2613924 RepID=UPI003994DC37